jgi:hypothetical protein
MSSRAHIIRKKYESHELGHLYSTLAMIICVAMVQILYLNTAMIICVATVQILYYNTAITLCTRNT